MEQCDAKGGLKVQNVTVVLIIHNVTSSVAPQRILDGLRFSRTLI